MFASRCLLHLQSQPRPPEAGLLTGGAATLLQAPPRPLRGLRACVACALLLALVAWVLTLAAVATSTRMEEGGRAALALCVCRAQPAPTSLPCAALAGTDPPEAAAAAAAEGGKPRSVLELRQRRPWRRLSRAGPSSGALGRGTAASAAAGAGTGGASAPTEQAPSSLKVLASYSSKGELKKYYHSYANVRLTRRELQFFGAPPPPAPLWVDVVSGNATSPAPPTMLVLKGEAKNTKW